MSGEATYLRRILKEKEKEEKEEKKKLGERISLIGR